MASASATARPASLGCTSDPFGQRFALDQLQDQAAHAVCFFDAVDGADVRMIERGEHPRFALEARAAFRIGGERRRQDFDRDLASERIVVGAVHLAHAADAEQGTNRVDAEALADPRAWRDAETPIRRRPPPVRS